MSRHDSPVSNANKPHRVLVVGGSYGGLSFIVNLLDLIDGKPARLTHDSLPDFAGRTSQRGVEITLLDERDGFFHTVGAPLAHTAKQHVVSFWKEFSALKELRHPSLTTARGRIDQLDCEARRANLTNLTSGVTSHLDYDHVLVATGLRRQWPIVPESHSKDRYVMDALQHINTLEASKRVVVIGGGAVGIEVAAELKVNNPHIHVTLVHSRDQLLSNEPLPAEFKDRARIVMEEEGVEVLLGQRAKVYDTKEGDLKRVELTNGTIIEAGAVIQATAKCPPNTEALSKQVLDADGYVKILANLNFPTDAPNNTFHSAIGDICAWSGIKRAGGAMHMGQVAAVNIWANILNSEDETLKLGHVELPDWPNVMGLAVGKQALGYGGPGTEVTYGTQTLAEIFGDDLAWSSCLKYMKLTDIEDGSAGAAVTAKVES